MTTTGTKAVHRLIMKAVISGGGTSPFGWANHYCEVKVPACKCGSATGYVEATGYFCLASRENLSKKAA